ncbi:hypothetical protein TNCT_405421 [Trichonephila clavata]|uniref:Uncharacterized protein n=1 Tax=Trichonephila clavata TaxID=2740835 RepID=A0A8X6KAW4_TRICU|nr:hypothetical protein TNCT_405421 [Trichonephila clavata]
MSAETRNGSEESTLNGTCIKNAQINVNDVSDIPLSQKEQDWYMQRKQLFLLLLAGTGNAATGDNSTATPTILTAGAVTLSDSVARATG